MKLSHIRDVLAVAEFGSLRAASRQIGIAQPAITRSIHEIEREFSAQLFERHPKGMRLTLIGEAFRRRAVVIYSEMRRTREEIAHLNGEGGGEISVGALRGCQHLSPRTCDGLVSQRHPDTLLKVIETFIQPVERELIDGAIDFYVGALGDSVTNPHLSVKKLFFNQRVVVGRRGHPLATHPSPEGLSSAKWVRGALLDHISEAAIADMLSENGLAAPRIVMNTRSTLQTLLMVTSTDLLTVVPQQWLEMPALAAHLDAIPLIKPMMAAPVCLVRRVGAPLTPVAEHFYDIFLRLGRNREQSCDLRRWAASQVMDP